MKKARLTEEELMVAGLWAEGLGYAHIAVGVGIPEAEVKTILLGVQAKHWPINRLKLARALREDPFGDGPKHITARMDSVLRLCGAGHSTAEIAEQMGMSYSHVQATLSRGCRRLGITEKGKQRRAMLDRWAREGLVPPPPCPRVTMDDPMFN